MKKQIEMFVVFIALIVSLPITAQDLLIKAPIGKWYIETMHPSGAKFQVEMEIKDDKTFNGILSINEVKSWVYSGTWELNGNEFTYIYLESSKELPAGYKDVDYILKVDDKQYHYKSKLTGEENIYLRVK